MTLPLLPQWRLLAFPELTWLPADSTTELLFLVGAFVALFLFASVFGIIIAVFMPGRRQSLNRTLVVLYAITGTIIMMPVAVKASHIPYAPVMHLLALLLLYAIPVATLLGSFPTYKRESEIPPSLTEYFRANYWFMLVAQPFLLLIVFLHVPLISPQHHTVYWGPISASLTVYFLLLHLTQRQGARLLGLIMSPDELEDNLRPLFDELAELVHRDGQLVLLRPGMRNAMAQYPEMIISLGGDLLRYLEPDQVRAVVLHEIGHLRDQRYMLWMHRVGMLLPFIGLGYIAVSQADLFSNALIKLALFLGGIIILSSLFRRLHLRAEYVADTFVKEYPGDLHGSLLVAIARINHLNGVDPDLCKKTNHGHLDLDERKEMVEQGRFMVRRKRLRSLSAFFVPMLIALVIVVFTQLGWERFFPSDSKQWGELHSRFHSQRYRNATEAEQTIQEALAFSLEHFGEVHSRTYLSLNDLAVVLLDQERLSDAEETAQRAQKVGEQLYGRDDLHRVRDMQLAAKIRLAKKNQEGGQEIYTDILALQQKLGANSEDMSSTLYILANLSDGEESIGYYKHILRLYREQPSDTESVLDEYIFRALANAYMEAGRIKEADKVLAEGVELTQDKFGDTSSAYALILRNYAEFLMELGEPLRAQALYEHCLALFDGVSLEESASCCYGLAILHRTQRDFPAAEQAYGPDSPDLINILIGLLSLVEENGDGQEAEVLRRRIERLKK